LTQSAQPPTFKKLLTAEEEQKGSNTETKGADINPRLSSTDIASDA